MRRFKNREEAGDELADLIARKKIPDPIVIAIPRGGVPVAQSIARKIRAPLDLIVTRKVGAPGNPEYGVGAVGENGFYWLDSEAVEALGVEQKEIDEVILRETAEVDRRIDRLRGHRPLRSVDGKTVILVDDGLATGRTARVAAMQLKERGASSVILVVPVCSESSDILMDVDELICLYTDPDFFAVGNYYDDFSEVTEDEISAIFSGNEFIEKNLSLTIEGGESVSADLTIPHQCIGTVLFAHGSGSSRFSPRNREVARFLNEHQVATVLADLLTEREALDRDLVFDIPLLAERLIAFTEQVLRTPELRSLPIAYFGASTGAASALFAAMKYGDRISSVVSRGGRPDLVISHLSKLKTPTLLLVGSKDSLVLEFNEEALKKLSKGELDIIPGATHLFEEPGALEEVSAKALNFISKYFRRRKVGSAA